MKKTFLPLAIALCCSLLLHAIVLIDFNNAKSSSGASAATAIPKLEEQSKPTKKSPVQKGKKEKPMRLAINDPKLENNDGAPKPKSQQTSVATPEKSETSVNIKNNTETAQIARKEATKPKTVKPKETKQTYKETIKKLEQAEKKTIQSKMTSSQYKLMLQKQKIGKFKGAQTPRLDIVFQDTAQILNVHKYFGMKIVALNPQSPLDVVELTNLGTENVDYQKIPNFNWQSYSNRIFPRTSPYFSNHLNKISSRNILKGSNIKLVSITPNSPDSYFRFKQLNVLKRNGLKEKDIASTIASFKKTSFGSWLLVIEKVQSHTGEILSVTDFEVQEISK